MREDSDHAGLERVKRGWFGDVGVDCVRKGYQRAGVPFGFVNRDELKVGFYYVTFGDPAAAVPAVLEYLCGQGCSRVEFGMDVQEEEDEEWLEEGDL